MPKPATLLDMVEVIRASRLVEEPRLQAALAGHAGRPPGDLLDRLVTDGTCTAFQAEQLAQGRWRGFVAGPYRLLDRLGVGGMGQVFLAEHATTGRAVAVKLHSSFNALAFGPMKRNALRTPCWSARSSAGGGRRKRSDQRKGPSSRVRRASA